LAAEQLPLLPLAWCSSLCLAWWLQPSWSSRGSSWARTSTASDGADDRWLAAASSSLAETDSTWLVFVNDINSEKREKDNTG